MLRMSFVSVTVVRIYIEKRRLATISAPFIMQDQSLLTTPLSLDFLTMYFTSVAAVFGVLDVMFRYNSPFDSLALTTCFHLCFNLGLQSYLKPFQPANLDNYV